MKHYKKIFNNLQLLENMIKDRKNGFSIPALGIKYKVDNSTISYHLKKNRMTKNSNEIISCIKTQDFLEEKINPGKTYQEYCDEEKQRKL